MKTKVPVLISMVLLLFLAVACTEEELLQESSETTPPRSRAEVDYNNESTTNPNLFDDWENVTTIELNSTSGAIGSNSVTAPWADGGSTSLSDKFCKDVKKADGWVMLFHTFKKKGLDNHKNYICLYNKFTGVIKVFYFNEADNFGSTITYWNLDSSKPLRLLDAPSRFTKPNDVASSNSSVSLTNEVNTSAENENNHGLIPAWNGFTYQVPSYFKEDYDCSITIGALDKFVTSFKFSGQTSNKITGTITSITSSDKNVANGSARQGEISRYGTAASDFLTFLKNQSGKTKEQQKLEGCPLTISDDLRNLLKNVTGNPYFNAFQSGLNLLFNRSTVTNYYTTSDVRLESQGHLLITGTSELVTSSPVYNVRFNLKDVLNGTVPSGSGLVLSSEGIGLENLGTWTIKSLPKIYYERISPIYPLSYTQTHNEWDRVEVTGNLVPPPYHCSTPELIINKDLKQYVTYSHLTMELVGCIKADNQYYGSWYEINHNTNYIGDTFSNDIYSGIGTPTLYNDSINHIYSVPTELIRTTIRTPFTSEQINDQVYNMYYDWGTILRGRMIAMVTAEIHYNFNGKTIKTLETRSYPVKYGYSDATKPEYYHNPPHDFVINYQCPLRRDLEYYYGNNPSLVP